MELIRKPFQGVLNIIKFNWHFYVLSALAILVLVIYKKNLDDPYKIYVEIFCLLAFLSITVSLLVSFYIYDLSNLYKLNWLDKIDIAPAGKIINIHAGFDETSGLLKSKYPGSDLLVFDFYDPVKHTEISIKRARRSWKSYPGTIAIETNALPLQDNSIDNIFLVFSAHEIRNDQERVIFFKELDRVLKPSGKIVVTEHLRNLSNFLAYSIGFFHFFSTPSWHRTFAIAGLNIYNEINITPFIKSFIIQKNGTSS